MRRITKRKSTSGSERLKIAWQQDYKCNTCGQMLHWTFEIDHIVALCNGGDNNSKNLQALCVQCHKDKSMQERHCAPSDLKLCSMHHCTDCGMVYSLFFRHKCQVVHNCVRIL